MKATVSNKATCPMCGAEWRDDRYGTDRFACGTQVNRRSGAIVQDTYCAVTAMYRALKAIAESNDVEKIRAIAEAACDGDGWVTWTSPRLMDLLGGA